MAHLNKKISCVCFKCGLEALAIHGDKCPNCGPWGMMESVEAAKTMLLGGASIKRIAPMIAKTPDTPAKLIELWGKIPPPAP